MEEKKVLLFSEALTEKARTLFGDDIVDKAFAATSDYGNDAEFAPSETVNDRLERAERATADKKDDDIRFDAECFVILFKNGKSVLFISSEWASVSAINMKAESTVIL